MNIKYIEKVMRWTCECGNCINDSEIDNAVNNAGCLELAVEATIFANGRVKFHCANYHSLVDIAVNNEHAEEVARQESDLEAEAEADLDAEILKRQEQAENPPTSYTTG